MHLWIPRTVVLHRYVRSLTKGQPTYQLIEQSDCSNPIIPPLQTVCPHPVTVEALDKMSRWINDYFLSNSRCAESVSSTFVSKRMIQLRGSMCLVPPESPVRYAALSY